MHAGDSHTCALTERGAIWAWGTFRDASGVFGFSPSQRIALAPTLVHSPQDAAQRAVKIASGAAPPWARVLIHRPDGLQTSQDNPSDWMWQRLPAIRC